MHVVIEWKIFLLDLVELGHHVVNSEGHCLGVCKSRKSRNGFSKVAFSR